MNWLTLILKCTHPSLRRSGSYTCHLPTVDNECRDPSFRTRKEEIPLKKEKTAKRQLLSEMDKNRLRRCFDDLKDFRCVPSAGITRTPFTFRNNVLNAVHEFDEYSGIFCIYSVLVRCIIVNDIVCWNVLYISKYLK